VQRLVFPVPYSLEVVLVPRLLVGSDEIVDKCLAQFFPGVKIVLGQAKDFLTTPSLLLAVAANPTTVATPRILPAIIGGAAAVALAESW